MVDYALAGAGWISAVHAMSISALDGRLVGVASRTPEGAARRGASAGAATLTYRDLPAGADIVVVATPPSHHAVHALRALAGGAVVVVEKPLCATLDHADRLVRVADAGGAIVYADNLMFSDAVQRTLAEIHRLGPLRDLRARTLQPRPTWGTHTTRSWGGGVLFDLGVHPLALVVRAATALPVAVRAHYERSDDVEVEDLATVEVDFGDGLTAHVEASWRTDQPIWDLQAASDHGVVRLDLLPELCLERDGDPVDLAQPPDDDLPPRVHQLGYVDQLREAEAVFGGRAPGVSDARFGRTILEIVCAASVSAATGVEVPLPYDGPRDQTPAQLWSPGPPDRVMSGLP